MDIITIGTIIGILAGLLTIYDIMKKKNTQNTITTHGDNSPAFVVNDNAKVEIQLTSDIPKNEAIIYDKFVDINYPSDIGIQKKLENMGYKTRWCAKKNLSRRIDIEGWEEVLQKDKEGKLFRLKCDNDKDPQTLIMKKKNV